jgi:hypothetical protein
MELTTFTIEDLQKSFYDKKFYFSYSSLNKLLYCPEIFYKEYVLGEKEIIDAAYLTEGKLIHCLLLEPKKFEEQFIVMTGKMPGDNTKTVIDRVYAHHLELYESGEPYRGETLADYQNAVIDVLKDMNLHQSLKTDEQRFAKIYTADANIYWEFLFKSRGKQIVDSEMYEKCKTIVEKIRQNKQVSDLLKLNAESEWWSTTDVYNEEPIEMELKKFPFGLKGILDNIVIDPIDKVIRINDFKTTSKALIDFPETIKYYKYSLQAAVYNLLVINKFVDLVKDGYKVEFRFIVVDKNQQIYPFKVSEDTMKEWTKELQDVLKIAEYHYTAKDYTLPYVFTKNEFEL